MAPGREVEAHALSLRSRRADRGARSQPPGSVTPTRIVACAHAALSGEVVQRLLSQINRKQYSFHRFYAPKTARFALCYGPGSASRTSQPRQTPETRFGAARDLSRPAKHRLCADAQLRRISSNYARKPGPSFDSRQCSQRYDGPCFKDRSKRSPSHAATGGRHQIASTGSRTRRLSLAPRKRATPLRAFHAAVEQPEMALVVFFCSSEYDLERACR